VFFVSQFAVPLGRGKKRRVNLLWLSAPLFDRAGHHISLLRIAVFVGLMGLGLICAKLLQSGVVRRFLSRFKLDANFVTTILSVAARDHPKNSALKPLPSPGGFLPEVPSSSGRINSEENTQHVRLKRSNSCHRYQSQQAETA